MNKTVIFWVISLLILVTIPSTATSECEIDITEKASHYQDEDNSTDDEEEYQENRIAIIDTSYGIIKFELFERRAPITTANFINLSIDAFYDGILFHRVIDDFVIQTGDPNSRDDENPYNDGSGGSEETIPLEIHSELTHVDGAVGMARSNDPDSASSQFYICDGPQHGLDGNYAVFGVVIEGIDVVRKIAQVETWGNKRPLLKDHPIEDVIMYSVFITEDVSGFELPKDNNDDTLFIPSFRTPGFDGAFTLIGLMVVILIYRKKRTNNR